MHPPDSRLNTEPPNAPPSPSAVAPPAQDLPRSRWARLRSSIGIWTLMAALVLGVVVLTRQAPSPNAAHKKSTPSTVTVAAVERRDVPIWLEALGTVTAESTVVIRPQVSGVLTAIHFTEGQLVSAGDLLATLDARPFDNALLQAQGVRRRDEAQLAHARATLHRQHQLMQEGMTTRQDLETQAALVKQLEGTVATDAAAERAARLNLDYTRMTAPVAGRIGLRQLDTGNTLDSRDAAGLAVLTQMSPISVTFNVPQESVTALMPPGKGPSATPPFEAEVWDRNRVKLLDRGQFVTLDNHVDTSTGTVKAKARFANAEHTLFPNQFVHLRLKLDTLNQAMVVPVTAVRPSPQGSFVYVLDEAQMTVRPQTVQTGPATPRDIVITAGLQGTERVITEGADRLKEGAAVHLPPPPSSDHASAAARSSP